MVMRFFRKPKRDNENSVDNVDNTSDSITNQSHLASSDYPITEDTALDSLESIDTMGMAAQGAQRLNDRVKWSHSSTPALGRHDKSPETVRDDNRSMRVMSSNGMARFSQRAIDDSNDIMTRNSHPTGMWRPQEMSEDSTSPQMTLRAKIRQANDTTVPESELSTAPAIRQSRKVQDSVSTRDKKRKLEKSSVQTRRDSQNATAPKKSNAIRKAAVRVSRTIRRSVGSKARSESKRASNQPSGQSKPKESAPVNIDKGRVDKSSTRRYEPTVETKSNITIVDVNPRTVQNAGVQRSQQTMNNSHIENASAVPRSEDSKRNAQDMSGLGNDTGIVARLGRPIRRVFRKEVSRSSTSQPDVSANTERRSSKSIRSQNRDLGNQSGNPPITHRPGVRFTSGEHVSIDATKPVSTTESPESVNPNVSKQFDGSAIQRNSDLIFRKPDIISNPSTNDVPQSRHESSTFNESANTSKKNISQPTNTNTARDAQAAKPIVEVNDDAEPLKRRVHHQTEQNEPDLSNVSDFSKTSKSMPISTTNEAIAALPVTSPIRESKPKMALRKASELIFRKKSKPEVRSTSEPEQKPPVKLARADRIDIAASRKQKARTTVVRNIPTKNKADAVKLKASPTAKAMDASETSPPQSDNSRTDRSSGPTRKRTTRNSVSENNPSQQGKSASNSKNASTANDESAHSKPRGASFNDSTLASENVASSTGRTPSKQTSNSLNETAETSSSHDMVLRKSDPIERTMRDETNRASSNPENADNPASPIYSKSQEINHSIHRIDDSSSLPDKSDGAKEHKTTSSTPIKSSLERVRRVFRKSHIEPQIDTQSSVPAQLPNRNKQDTHVARNRPNTKREKADSKSNGKRQPNLNQPAKSLARISRKTIGRVDSLQEANRNNRANGHNTNSSNSVSATHHPLSLRKPATVLSSIVQSKKAVENSYDSTSAGFAGGEIQTARSAGTNPNSDTHISREITYRESGQPETIGYGAKTSSSSLAPRSKEARVNADITPRAIIHREIAHERSKGSEQHPSTDSSNPSRPENTTPLHEAIIRRNKPVQRNVASPAKRLNKQIEQPTYPAALENTTSSNTPTGKHRPEAPNGNAIVYRSPLPKTLSQQQIQSSDQAVQPGVQRNSAPLDMALSSLLKDRKAGKRVNDKGATVHPFDHTDAMPAQRAVNVNEIDVVPDDLDRESTESFELTADQMDRISSKVYDYIKHRLQIDRERQGRPGFSLWP